MKNQLTCKTVLLPTEKAIENGIIKCIKLVAPQTFQVTRNVGKGNEIGSLHILRYAGKNNEEGFQAQHLYLVSDREIKEGDWFINENQEAIQTQKYYNSITQKCKKIEATTNRLIIKFDNQNTYDNSSDRIVPQIPQSFIEAYVKANGNIKEVNIEMEIDNSAQYFIASQFGDYTYKIKTRPDNTIVINPTKTYTREEVIEILSKYLKDLNKGHASMMMKPDEWFNEYIK